MKKARQVALTAVGSLGTVLWSGAARADVNYNVAYVILAGETQNITAYCQYYEPPESVWICVHYGLMSRASYWNYVADYEYNVAVNCPWCNSTYYGHNMLSVHWSDTAAAISYMISNGLSSG